MSGWGRSDAPSVRLVMECVDGGRVIACRFGGGDAERGGECVSERALVIGGGSKSIVC